MCASGGPSCLKLGESPDKGRWRDASQSEAGRNARSKSGQREKCHYFPTTPWIKPWYLISRNENTL